MLHCPHAGFLGAPGGCGPFRTDTAVESTTATGYVRVDRMGMPAVATALIGPGLPTAGAMNSAKDDYNDSDPTSDAQFVSGVPLITAISTLHMALVAAHLTPCSIQHTFPVPGAPAMVPACGVQQYDAPPGMPGHTVASLVIPDTLRIDMASATTFPNGRALADDVIDPILSVLLLNLSPCAGTPHGDECPSLTAAGMATCTGDANCAWSGTACLPNVGTPAATCGAITTMGPCNTAAPVCFWTGSACVPTPCEFLPAAAACGAVAGCVASTCGAGASPPACTAATVGTLGLNPQANDVAFGTTFPYFAAAH